MLTPLINLHIADSPILNIKPSAITTSNDVVSRFCMICAVDIWLTGSGHFYIWVDKRADWCLISRFMMLLTLCNSAVVYMLSWQQI